MRACAIVTRIWASDEAMSCTLTRVAVEPAGSRTIRKIGTAKIANRMPAIRKIGSGVSVMPSRIRVSAAKIVPM